MDPTSARFQRHLILPDFGLAHQTELVNSKVLVVGAGGLGCPAMQYLASSGIGEIGLIDGDQIDESNLSRQVLYGAQDIGKLKVEVAKFILTSRYTDIKVTAYAQMLDAENVDELVQAYDVILDCTDNFSVRYLLSDATANDGKAVVYAALHKYEGQLSVFNYKGGASFRALFPNQAALESIPTCQEVGVLSVLPGIMGVMQAAEAIKIITGIGHVMSGKLLIYSSLTCKTTIIDTN